MSDCDSITVNASRSLNKRKNKLTSIYITGRALGTNIGPDNARGVGVPGFCFDTPAGIMTRCSFVGSSGAL